MSVKTAPTDKTIKSCTYHIVFKCRANEERASLLFPHHSDEFFHEKPEKPRRRFRLGGRRGRGDWEGGERLQARVNIVHRTSCGKTRLGVEPQLHKIGESVWCERL